MLMDIIKARHSIRKYTDKQIRREDLEKILEAGNFAPNAGGGIGGSACVCNSRQ